MLAKYPKQDSPLESGMVIHPEVLEDKVAALEVQLGRGRIVLYGYKPQHRGQAHGTYRAFFNALYLFDDPPMPNDGTNGSGSPDRTSIAAAPSEAAATAGPQGRSATATASGAGTAANSPGRRSNSAGASTP